MFDKWAAGAPFYVMAMLNGVALVTGLVVTLAARRTAHQREDDEEVEPLLVHQ